MRSSQWKNVERRIADLFGGKRVTSKYTDVEDVDHPWLSIEVKYRKQLPALLRDAMAQCVSHTPESKWPLVVVTEHGMILDGYCVMRVRDFLSLHRAINSPVVPRRSS